MEGDVSLDVGSIESVDGSDGLLVDPGTDCSEDEAPHAEDEHTASEPYEADGTEGGVELYAEVEEGGKQEEILQRQELEGQAKHLAILMTSVISIKL